MIEIKGQSEQEEKCLCSFYSYEEGKLSDKVFWELEEVRAEVKSEVKVEECYFPRGRMLRFE
jgi:hypothetical protein